MRVLLTITGLVGCMTAGCALDLPPSDEQPQVILPDYGAELRAFNYPDKHPISWHEFMLNAGYGEGRGGPSRQPGKWFDQNWMLCDYLDRSGDYISHDYLKHRGIPYEVYGSNEYQETIHFHESLALPLFRDNGIARDYNNELVMSQHYNLTVESWAKSNDFNAYIVCNNAPRWSAVINYDLLASPTLGFACSQDNIGGPVTRIGSGSRGRYCDFCNRKFFHYLESTGKLPEFRAKYQHIRDYVQDNLMDVFAKLPPNVKWNEFDPAIVASICDDPVMAEYQKFLFMSHAHNLMRYYLDQKAIAEREGIEYDVHGNQGGGFVGLKSYQLLISEFVDQVWFESAGQSQYDIFKYHWWNADGALRHVLGLAAAAGRKPVLFMTKLRKYSPDLLAHEYGESCAGGTVLFSQQPGFQGRPELQKVVHDYWRFRHDHRALFTPKERRRHAQVAIASSIPTQMYTQYQTVVNTPHFNDLCGMARSLFEGHIPFDALIFQHPEMRADRWTLEDLKRYRLLILPAVTCISDEQAEVIGEYLESGGRVATIEACGVRDENNVLRETPVTEQWKQRGRVIELLDGKGFPFCRVTESDATRAVADKAIAEIREALAWPPILEGDIPRMLWATAWVHADECVSVHFVNYDVDFESGEAAPTQPFELTLRMPAGVPAKQTAWLTVDGEQHKLEFETKGENVTLTVPSVKVYGVLVVGKPGLDRERSDRLQGDAMLARTRFALDGWLGAFGEPVKAVEAQRETDPGAYRRAAEQLLRDVAQAQDEKLFEEMRQAADTEGAILALDFGATEDAEPWKAVGPDTEYSAERGFGWLPADDDSEPTPEETAYGSAYKWGKAATEIVSHGPPFWPYKWRPDPVLVQHALYSGMPRSFRLDVPDGDYRVDVVTCNSSWAMRNFRVSGMVREGGGVKLFDWPLKPGDSVRRSFDTRVGDGHLDLTFGGPTGWGVSAVIVYPEEEVTGDALPMGALREWRVSPRFANPEWWPIRQVRFSPEDSLASPPADQWTAISADAGGVVHLGSNVEAETGDVVYATAIIDSEAAVQAPLNLSSSSSAIAYLNGEEVAYLPNVRGLQRDECVVDVPLKAGRNVLVLKLQRFWERHWMFYASTGGG